LRDYCHNEEKNVRKFVAWVEHNHSTSLAHLELLWLT
jgi:hypothetical protein